MQEDIDSDLTRLFDEARHALPPGEFAERVGLRIHGARRRRALRRILTWLAVAVCAAAASPYAVQASLALVDRMEQWLPDLGRTLVSPAGWACSILLALWLLRRVKVLHR